MECNFMNLAGLFGGIGINVPGVRIGVHNSISIEDGETVHSMLKVVNGHISIGSNCKVNGNSICVNGAIQVGNNSKVNDLVTVNGGVTIGESTSVRGCISAVNGRITCAPGVHIEGGEISSVNGSINLTNTTVEADITVCNSNITLLKKSNVEGDIIVQKKQKDSKRRSRVKIEITDNSTVEGDIVVESEEAHVKVILSKGGKVNGKIENADVINK
jgi:predicted acyltransferase (DUF342 family)